jgi:hypothetical protein
MTWRFNVKELAEGRSLFFSLEILVHYHFVSFLTLYLFSVRTMVRSLFFLPCSFIACYALGLVPPVFIRRVRATTQLYGLFDFNPFKGSGSGGNQDFLDEQWEAQQAILRARQGQFTKEDLQKKYKPQPKEDSADTEGVPTPSKNRGESSSFFAEVKEPPVPQKVGSPFDMKFPWDKK